MNLRLASAVVSDVRRRLPAAVLVAVGVAASACTSGSSNGSPTPINVSSPKSTFAGATYTPAKHLPDVTLTDNAGRPWNLQAQGRGKVTVTYFGYTKCSDACPTDMAALARAVSQLSAAERAQVQVVFVTVDLKRDTRPVIRQWLDRFDKRIPPFVGLTGSASDVKAAANQLGMQFKVTSSTAGLEEVEHSSQMTAFNQDGTSNLVWLDPPVPSDIAHDLRLLLDGTSPV
jgi:protein SCO1/2